MLTAKEINYIKANAYIPEHMPAYVRAVSGAEPYLIKTFLCYKKGSTLIFIGYPLGEPFEEKKTKNILDIAIKDFKPDEIALIAPSAGPYKDAVCQKKTTDIYYGLNMSRLNISHKVKNMINRASREIGVETGQECSDEHLSLIAEFLESHEIGEETQYIFDKIPVYISSSETALVINARDRQGKLTAFDVAELDSRDNAFYMFNFASRKFYVPGTSDLLLNELIHLAQERGKRFINLGLGIDEGVTFFKRKWGGRPFLAYEFCQYKIRRTPTIGTLLKSYLNKIDFKKILV